MSRAKNPKYESMSLKELKANMEKSRQELEAALHHKNLLEQSLKKRFHCPEIWNRKTSRT